MRKSATSFLILTAAALFMALEAKAQFNFSDGYSDYPDSNPEYNEIGLGEVISQRVEQILRPYERRELSELLQLSSYDHRNLRQVQSLIITASSYGQPTQLQLQSQGQPLARIHLNRSLQSERIVLSRPVLLQNLELTSFNDVQIHSITAELSSQGGPGFPPSGPILQPNSIVTLQINQRIHGQGVIDLEQVALRQHGIRLDGAEIERVVLEADPIGYNQSATAQVELNHRLVGPAKFISSQRERIPFPVSSSELVRSLRLLVNGSTYVESVLIRVGRVRQQPQLPQIIQVPVHREIMMGQEISFGELLPYEQRLVRTIRIQGQPRRAQQSRVQVFSQYELIGEILVDQSGQSTELRLFRPVSVQDLKISSQSPVQVSSIQLEL